MGIVPDPWCHGAFVHAMLFEGTISYVYSLMHKSTCENKRSAKLRMEIYHSQQLKGN